MRNEIVIVGDMIVACDLDEGVKPLHEIGAGCRRYNNPFPVILGAAEELEQSLAYATTFERDVNEAARGGQR